MPFRNPRYLDPMALANIADYYGVELPEQRQVTRKISTSRGGHAGTRHVVDAGIERSGAEEIVESYSVYPRPVRAMNDVLDNLVAADVLIDLIERPQAPISQGSVIQITGEITVSPVTEIGAVMAAALPVLIGQAASGKGMDSLDQGELGGAIFRGVLGVDRDNLKHVYEVQSANDDERTVRVIVDPQRLFGSTELDDLDGEFTVFGIADRLIAQGREYSLERYLLPQLNRSFRRALGTKSINDVLGSFKGLLGKELDLDSINLHGPALVVMPVAIY